MTTSATTTTSTDSLHPLPRPPWLRAPWLLLGGLALCGLGLAAGLAWRPAPQSELLAPGSFEATRASLAPNEAVVEGRATAPTAGTPPGTAMPSAAGEASAGSPAAQRPAAPRLPADRPGRAIAQRDANPRPALPVTQPAPVCGHCGVIEDVRQVTVKGKGSGVGAVAGGVLGGAVGNQMGHGNGRTAMTVLGAIGGGVAGHEVEKYARRETVYDVRVRMDDGSVRTFQQKTAPTAGARVTVEGHTLHLVRAGANSHAGA
jgi:outer membrane lipoprotein SlyB